MLRNLFFNSIALMGTLTALSAFAAEESCSVPKFDSSDACMKALEKADVLSKNTSFSVGSHCQLKAPFKYSFDVKSASGGCSAFQASLAAANDTRQHSSVFDRGFQGPVRRQVVEMPTEPENGKTQPGATPANGAGSAL
jgi:hypothetical protein